MLLDRAPPVIQERHQRAGDATWAIGRRSPNNPREARILAIHDQEDLRPVGGEPIFRHNAAPDRLATRPGAPPGLILACQSLGAARRRCRSRGRRLPCTTKELMDTRRDHTAWTGHPLHFPNDLFDLRNDIQGQRGNGHVEFAVVEPHVADIAVLISDVGVGSAKAGASFQVSLGRCVDTDYVRARLGQCLFVSTPVPQATSSTFPPGSTSARARNGFARSSLHRPMKAS